MNERLELVDGERAGRAQPEAPLLNRHWSLRGRWRKLGRCPACGDDIVLADRIVYIYGETVHAGCAWRPSAYPERPRSS